MRYITYLGEGSGFLYWGAAGGGEAGEGAGEGEWRGEWAGERVGMGERGAGLEMVSGSSGSMIEGGDRPCEHIRKGSFISLKEFKNRVLWCSLFFFFFF